MVLMGGGGMRAASRPVFIFITFLWFGNSTHYIRHGKVLLGMAQISTSGFHGLRMRDIVFGEASKAHIGRPANGNS